MPYIVTEVLDGGDAVPKSIRGRFSFSIKRSLNDFSPFTIAYANKTDADEGQKAAEKMIKNAVS
jgi:hypothetical protein